MLLMFWNMPGQHKSDIELGQEIGTDPVLGTSNEAFLNSLKNYGLSYTAKSYASFEDIAHWLEKGIPVVVDWFSPGRKDAPSGDMPDGHYSIVIELDEHHIILQDPETGGERTLSRSDFLRVWFDFTGEYITAPNELVVRWLAAVYPANEIERQ